MPGHTCILRIYIYIKFILQELIQREISAYSEVNFTEQTNSTASDSDPYESVTEGYYIDIPTNITRNNVKRTVEKSQTAGHERETRYRDFICKSGKEECYTIRCQLTNLIGSKKRNIVTVQLRSRLWNDTFKLVRKMFVFIFFIFLSFFRNMVRFCQFVLTVSQSHLHIALSELYGET